MERGPYTDIYALSATLYHTLTGEIPVEAPARAAGVPLPNPKQLNPEISDSVAEAIIAGLELDPRKRPQSIDEFLSYLRGRKIAVKALAIPKTGDFTLLRTLEGHSDYVRSVAFSPDGKLLATGSDDKTIKIWRVRDGRLLRTLEGHSDYVLSVAFSPDGELLALGSIDRTINIWRIIDGGLLRTLKGHSSVVESVAFSLDGELLASGSHDKTIKIWGSFSNI